MISKYADVIPDLFVRSNLAVLKQGNNSVQAYHDKFRTIISQADNHQCVEQKLCGTSNRAC